MKWRANGSVIDSHLIQSNSDGPIRISHLTWPADHVHNGTRITCVVPSETTASVESEPALLLIQGKRERFLILFTTICTHAHIRNEFHAARGKYSSEVSCYIIVLLVSNPICSAQTHAVDTLVAT